MLLPEPSELGLPKHFRAWRPGQESHIWRLLLSENRHSALVLPTGSGKSLTYVAYSIVQGGRTLILTSTKGLQDQLMRDFGGLRGWVEVRGQSNYRCALDHSRMVSEGPCHIGHDCSMRHGGCSYYDAVRAATRAQVVVTNYSFHFFANQYGQGIGRFDTLICDEAHSSPDEICEFLGCYVSRGDLKKFGVDDPPKESWARWAGSFRAQVQAELDVLKHSSSPQPAGIRHLKELDRRLSTLCSATPGAWTMEDLSKGFRWDLVWPGPYAEPLLFRQTPRVILVSATIRPRTLSLLGIDEGEGTDWFESDSLFPVRRRPVIWVPTVRMDYRASQEAISIWLSRIDEILKPRLDRKGIIHSVSYERRRQLHEASRFSRHMLWHEDSKALRQTVEEFKNSRPPAILLSPSVSTGFDFPYQQCEYQILPKVPFPSPSAVLKARSKIDPLYPYYLAMLQIVQAVGRGMRAPDDQCESFILDDHWGWFSRKYRSFAPRWFLRAVRSSANPPAPPPALGSGVDNGATL